MTLISRGILRAFTVHSICVDSRAHVGKVQGLWRLLQHGIKGNGKQ